MATNEFVEAETRERPRVAVLAALAAILTLVTPIVVSMIIIGRQPDNALSTALLVRYEHRIALLAGAIVSMLGLIAITLVLDFLLRATRRRYPQVPPFLRPMLLVAGIGLALFSTTFQVIGAIRFEHFATASTLTWEEMKHVQDFGAAVSFIGFAMQFAFVFAFVMVSLNAMRVGLLTRFMGYLGTAAAVLFIIPVFAGLPIVQTFWLLALAVLLWNVGNAREPPAWRLGEAVPWPSAAEMREQRVRAAEARRGGPRSEPAAIDAVEHDEEPDDADAHPAGGGGTSTRPRKRKKRR